MSLVTMNSLIQALSMQCLVSHIINVHIQLLYVYVIGWSTVIFGIKCTSNAVKPSVIYFLTALLMLLTL